jgi:antitoxin component HigA of HigAB toxin-antitoxin module
MNVTNLVTFLFLCFQRPLERQKNMLKPIKNNKQYEVSLSRIYELMQKNVKANSPESDELEVLSILVKQYEQEHYPVQVNVN